MGIFRFFVCLFLLLLSSASLASDTDNDGLDPLVANYLMAVGSKHACASETNTIDCWGDNEYGQLAVPEINQVTELAAGRFFTCAIHNNSVSCWGDNSQNQLQPPVLNNPRNLTLGSEHACVLDDSGVVCWGNNNHGQIDVPELIDPIKIDAGGNNTCAISSNQIFCWGYYSSWDGYDGSIPEEAINPTQLSVGYSSICFLDEDVLNCVQRLESMGGSEPQHIFAEFNWSPISGVDILYSSGSSAHCISKNNQLSCYGEYWLDNQDRWMDPVIHEATNPTAVSVGGALCFFSEGMPKCVNLGYWGSEAITAIPNLEFDMDNDGVTDPFDSFPLNSTEWLDTDFDGIGNNADSDDDGDGVLDANDQYPLDRKYSKDTDSDGLPDKYEEVTGLNKYLPADANSDIDNDGLIAAEEFGYGTNPNDDDSDSDGFKDSWEIENNQNPLVAAYQVSASYYHVCSLDDSGVVCWGRDYAGTLNIPQLVNPTQVSTASNRTCVLDDSGVVCWGAETHEGINNVPNLNNPTQVSSGGYYTCAIEDSGVVCWGKNFSNTLNVPSLRNPTQVSAGEEHVCAIDDLGVSCWGAYDEATGDSYDISAPDLVNPKQVSSGGRHSCALDNSGVVCWGQNWSGITTVPDLTNPIQVSSGGNHTCAIDDTGVVCWGWNGDGQTDVPVLSNPIQVSSGDDYTCAIDDSGLVCWGGNEYGQVNAPVLFVDHDGDGYSENGGQDVFPLDPNEWFDTDLDGIGNNADTDDDGDNVLDSEDLFPIDPSEWADTDNDGLGDNTDNCPQVANDSQEDMDADEIGDKCDADTDGDGVENTLDLFPFDVTEALDSDADGIGNNADPDDDNDGFADINDDLPLDSTEQQDTDADGIGNNTDTDDDGDGIEDGNDAFPLNELYSVDSDNDGMADAWEALYGLNPNDPSDTISDQDDDGAVALQEFIEGTLPVADADNDGLSDNYEVSIGTDPNDADSDDDGVNDSEDAFPLDSTETTDSDEDGVGDDGDAFPNDAFEITDSDSDGIGDNVDGIMAADGAIIIHKDTIWSASEIVLNSDIQIAYGAVLTIPLGTTLIGNGSEIIIFGALNIEGTNQNTKVQGVSIVFSSFSEQVGYLKVSDSVLENVFLFGPTGNASYGSFDIVDSTLNDISGMHLWYPSRDSSIESNVFQNFAGLSIGLRASNLVIRNNVFLNQTSSFAIENWANYNDTLVVEYNSFLDTDNIALALKNDYSDTYILATNNYFGTTDSSVIETRIMDANDSLSYASVIEFSPFLLQPHSNTPDLVDTDADATPNITDNCTDIANTDQLDTDGDSMGDACDTDDDNDGFADTYEIANNLDPLVANLDIDNDGIANELDTDNDNDGIDDAFDDFPLDSTEHLDTDSDGIGNNVDVDDDGDGVADVIDAFPLDVFESFDSDGDGIGDNTDLNNSSPDTPLDSDLDQIPDAWEIKYFLNPLDPSDALLDQDSDGLTALEEYEAGTIPLMILDIDANGSFDALTDGLIILRYAFGLTGENLVSGTVAADAMRTNPADIEAYIDSLVPGL